MGKDDDDSDAISEDELDEALEYLVTRGALDYLGDESSVATGSSKGDAAATVAEFFERSGDDLADIRVAHAAQRAINLVRNMVGVFAGPAVDAVELAAREAERGIHQAHLSLSGPTTT